MFDEVTILAVDDDSMNLNILEIMLAEMGSTFLKAKNGLQAIEILEKNAAVDIILLDLEMPVMNGYETITRVKHHDTWREIPIIVVTAGSHEVARTLALGANDFIAKPYNQEELRLRVMNHVRSKKLSDMARDMNQILEQEVIRKTADLQRALAQSKEAEYEISLRLGKAAEFRDQDTGMHTRRISELSTLLGELAGLTGDQCELLRKTSPLHDVGKIGIPDTILLKPGKLEQHEFETMKAHTTIGGEILADNGRYQLLNSGAIIALQHHEKWDGSGYPAGLKGDKIHEFARIVAIVDVFDALASVRPYKKAFPLDKIICILEEGRGTSFDPHLLDLFLENIDSFVVIRDAFKDSFEHSLWEMSS